MASRVSVARLVLSVCAISLASSACGKARVDGDELPNAGRAASAGSSGSGASGADGRGGASGTPGVEQALPADMRRLTGQEYRATIADVLGTALQPVVPEYWNEIDGFDNNALANGVDEQLYLDYLETAEALADEVFGSPQLRPQVVTCNLTDDVTCVRQVIAGAGLRLFRRPLLDEEIAAYQKAYFRARARSLDHDGALKEVLTALLSSPQFVYRMELVSKGDGTRSVSQYELATRLSYLLWSSAPDAQLLEAAGRNELATNEQLATATKRLLDNTRVERFAQNFAGQWLGSRRVATHPVDSAQFPAWNSEVATQAATEMDAYFAQFLEQPLDFRSFFENTAHFVKPDLAALYGLSSNGTGFTERVELNDADRRGFLGLVGVLALTSFDHRTSPTLRGKFVLERLLCSPLPPPPLDVPPLESNGAEPKSIRDYLTELAQNPKCGPCHTQMDPVGLALEHYDAIGRIRVSYADGGPIDSTGLSPGGGPLEGAQLNGMSNLASALAKSPLFPECAVKKVYVYGFGRSVGESDQGNVRALSQRWQAGPLTLRELVMQLVLSSEFRMRSDAGEP